MNRPSKERIKEAYGSDPVGGDLLPGYEQAGILSSAYHEAAQALSEAIEHEESLLNLYSGEAYLAFKEKIERHREIVNKYKEVDNELQSNGRVPRR